MAYMDFFELLYLMADKIFFPFIFVGWQATKKKAHSHPLQGLPKRSKFIKATLPLDWLTFHL